MTAKQITAACFLVLFSIVSCLSAPLVHAQSSSPDAPSGGLRITPAITQIKLQPHENTLTLQYIVSNMTHQPLSVAIGARDFGALSQSGSITLYGAGYNPSTNPHGIQSYVSLPTAPVIIPPNASQPVSVTIQNATKLAPGGHYGTILFSPQNAFAGTGSNRVNLNTSVAGLVFLTTAYGGTYDVSASMSHVSPIRFSLPSSVYLVFKNTGNTQSIPQGQLSLLGPRAKVLGTQVVNSSSGLILSGGSRIFQVQLPLNRHWYTPTAIYHLSLQYKDSQDTSFKTLNQSFVYVNGKVALLVVIALIAFGYLLMRFGKRMGRRLVSLKFPKRRPKVSNSAATTLTGSKVMDVMRPKRK